MNSLCLFLSACLLAFLLSQPSAAVKVSSRDSQSVVSQLLSETESSALEELSKIINLQEESTFSLDNFNDWLGGFMIDMFQAQSEEDTMFNVISYKCTKNLESYSYQVSYDEADLSRILNNKALCQLQETLTTGDLDTTSMLTDHMETAQAAVNSLLEARGSFYSEMYSVVNTVIGQIEESEDLVSGMLNGMDSSEVLSAMIQLRANTKEILVQSAKSGSGIERGLALVQTLSGSSSLSSYDLVAIQEMLSEMKEDVVQLIYQVQEDEQSEGTLLNTQKDLVTSLVNELYEESENFQSTVSSASECIESNESDEASLSETLQLEIQKLEDFQTLCDILTDRYTFISEKM